MIKSKIKKIKNLFSITQHELVGIDFSGNNLKLAQIRSSRTKSEVVNLLSKDISGLSDEQIAKIIVNALSELKINNPDIVSITPSPLVITKNIEIPSADPKEIRQIVNLQAGRHTPYSREEIIVDFLNVGNYKANYSKILLVIVSRKVAKRQSDILIKAGLEIEKMIFAPEALANSIWRMIKIEPAKQICNVLHIDDEFTDFLIFTNQRLLFIRSIPIGATHLIAERERYQVRFIEEVRRSYETYQSENIEKEPTNFILTGAIQDLANLESALSDNLSLPYRATPYFRDFAFSESALRTAGLAKHLSFLNIIASAISAAEVSINLIPEEVKLKKALEERGRDLIKTGILIISIFILIFSIIISKIYFKSARLKNIDEKYQVLNREAQEIEKKFSKIGMIKNYLVTRGYSLEVLTELYNLSSLDLELNDIRYDQEGKFSIRGTAQSMSVVFTFVESMNKSSYFKDVKTRYTTKRKEDNKDVTDFEITSVLNQELRK